MIADAWPWLTWDVCADAFGTALRAAQPAIPPTARVLEIGCAEYDFLTPASRVWPEMTFTGVDWRARSPAPEGVTVRQASVFDPTLFPHASFDWVVAISTIEHLGLGYYAQDPQHADGDTLAMRHAWQWLAPGGWFYLDVPWTPETYDVHPLGKYRLYDDEAIETRLLAPCVGARRHWSGTTHLSDPRTLVAEPGPREPLWVRALWLQKDHA